MRSLCSQIEQVDEIRGNGHAGARARASRHALRVVRIAGLAAPAPYARLPSGMYRSSRLSRARCRRGPPTLRRVAMAKMMAPFVAQVRDVGRVVLRHIHGEVDVVAAGRAHVLCVVPVLQRERHAVHRQLLEIGLGAVLLVQFGGALQRIGLFAELFARLRARRAAAGPSTAPCRTRLCSVTDRSPRMLRVSSALSWPALGMPTRMPYCCCTVGSDIVGSIRPNSIGSPAY